MGIIRSDGWFDPVMHDEYRVLSELPGGDPVEPSNQGRVGECIGKRESGFGMHWALLRFDDDRQPEERWFRTKHIEPAKE